MNGKEIKDLRDTLGMSQDDFAKALGISFSTISRWESGKSEPSYKQEQQLEALKSLSEEKDIDIVEVRKMLTVMGTTGVVTLAVAAGIPIAGVLAGTIGGFIGQKVVGSGLLKIFKKSEK